MSEVWTRLLLVSVGAGVALVVGEVMLRALEPSPSALPSVVGNPEGLHVLDDELGHRLGTNVSGTVVRPEFQVQVRTNALGLRDVELGPKAPNEFRILALGDSFTHGYGVEAEESYVEQLEALLEGSGAGLRVQAVNAGVSGYGTVQALRLMKRLVETIQPDLVLLGFFSENDIYDNLTFLERYEDHLPWRWSAWLRSRSRLFNRLERLLKKAEFALRFPSGMQVTMDAIEELIRSSREAGAGVAFVMIAPQPWRLEVSYALGEGTWAELRRRLRWDPRFQHQQITSQIRALGAPVLDTLEIVEALDEPLSHYYRENGHWRASLHRLVGRALRDFLVERGLVPGGASASRPAQPPRSG